MAQLIEQDELKPKLDSKVSGLVTHCLYLIATGKWGPGQRLPSIRHGETLWNLNRLTIQKAYRRLEDMGLVQSRIKSGYYVCESREQQEISRHRYALDNCFERFSHEIQQELGLSALGVFRYLAQKAEIEYSNRPEHAFLECTVLQAQGHASEIQQRLQLPVLALSTSEVNGQRSRIPTHIRTVFTTYFHYSELQSLEKAGDLDVIAVPIEVSPVIRQKLAEFQGKAYFFEIEDIQAHRISEDSKTVLENLEIEIKVVSDVEYAIRETISQESDSIIMLSPRLWGSISKTWRDHQSVFLVEFRIVASAWPGIAHGAGLPLGMHL